MRLLSLEPFIPSGSDFGKSKALFQELGFEIKWDAGGYTGFEKDGCSFILQNYHNEEFANNLMISVGIDDVASFRESLIATGITTRFNIRIGEITNQPYGKELNMIDLAGVCWHFVQR